MDKKRAYRIAIKAMQVELKKYAFDANLYRMARARYPHAKKANKMYIDLAQAIQFLEADGKQLTLEEVDHGNV